MDISIVRDLVDILAGLATVIGVPILVASFIISKRREERDREWGTYNTLVEDDNRFMVYCLENPGLDVLEWLPVPPSDDLEAAKERKETLLMAIQLNVMERAFLLYRYQESKLRKAQWEGWAADFVDHVKSPTFRRRCKAIDWQLDSDFMKHMNTLVQEFENRNPATSSSGERN